jgi:hypothetical protein
LHPKKFVAVKKIFGKGINRKFTARKFSEDSKDFCSIQIINSPYAEDLETLTPDPSPSGRGEKSPSGGCAPATLVYKPKYRLKEIRIPRNISY